MGLPYVTGVQAEKIAKEVVEKTPAPAGGTRLYKHILLFNITGEGMLPPTCPTEVITNSSSVFEASSSGPSRFVSEGEIISILNTITGNAEQPYYDSKSLNVNAKYNDISIIRTSLQSDKVIEL